MFLKKFADALLNIKRESKAETKTVFMYISGYFSIFQVPLAEVTMSLEFEISQEIKIRVFVFFNILTFPFNLSPRSTTRPTKAYIHV